MRQVSKLFAPAMLAALSLMVLAATRAQAETKGEWRIDLGAGLKTFTEDGLGSKNITFTVGAGELLAEGLAIHCTGGTGTGTVLAGTPTTSGTALAEATFSGCTVLESKFCKVYERLGTDKVTSTLTGEGKIKARGKGKLLLHKGKHYFLVEEDGEPFSLLDVYGELCPLIPKANTPLHVVIPGSLVVELPDALSDLKAHTFKTLTLAEQKTLFPGHVLKLGENPAHFSTKKSGEAETPVTASVELITGEIWGSE
jgi:hypothetical protein